MEYIVIYQSKYGHTKEYAEMIAKTLRCNAVPLKSVSKKELDSHETIIFGTGVYMGKMKKLQTFLNMIGDKQATIFACGGSINDEENVKNIKEKNFSEEQLQQHNFFYLPGGLDVSKVKGFMRLMFKVIGFVLRRKKDRTKDEEEFLTLISHPKNHVDISHIKPLVTSVTQ